MLLENKVAIVTGGARGIGHAVARRFLEDGARVVIADIDEDAGSAAVEELGAYGAVRFVACDVGERLDVHNLVAATVDAFGSVDALINNAGMLVGGEFLDLDEADFDRVIRTNLKGAFLCGQAVARVMVEHIAEGGAPGAIVNMSSVNAVFAIPNQVPYSVSKGGINQLTKVMALALAPHGIRVNAIGPGSIATDMLATVMDDAEARKRILSRTPLGRLGEPSGDRRHRRLPRLRRCQLYHRPDDLCRRRAAAAELHRAGQGIGLLDIVRLDRVDFRFAPRPWPFAEARRAEIDAHFRAAQAAQPALWNGRVLLFHEHAIADGALTGSALETDFASLLAWRDWGFTDRSVRNVFPQAALRSADGAFLLGVMAGHTANAGHIYFPSGTPDRSDISGDRVDLAAALVRELTEETGLGAGDVRFDPGWTAVLDGPRIALMRVARSPEPAAALRARILQNLASFAEPELADIRIMRSPADYDPHMTGYVTAYLDDVFRRKPPDTGLSVAPA